MAGSVTEQRTSKAPVPQAFELTVGIHAAKASQEHDGLTLIELAEIHEFGLGVPQRSFIRKWADEDSEKLAPTFQKELTKVITGEVAAQYAGDRLALYAQGKCQAFISDGRVEPALARETIARKGSSKPLIDTGALRSGITGEAEIVR